jgi:carbohydrate-selective porin (OprB family)
VLLRQQTSNRGDWNPSRLSMVAGLALLMMSGVANGAVDVSAQPTGAAPPGTPEQSGDRFAIDWQATLGFQAPYSGPNSLTPKSGKETFDMTLFAGARLWSGAEAWMNPEIDQGFGLDNTLGLAGFPSGEGYKVGKNQPYLRLPRLFVRQTIDLDDTREDIGVRYLQGVRCSGCDITRLFPLALSQNMVQRLARKDAVSAMRLSPETRCVRRAHTS